MKTKNALGYKKVVEGLKSLGQVVTANAIEKEETGRDRNKSYLFGGVFYFFVVCYKKGGIWNVSGGILFSFGNVDSCK